MSSSERRARAAQQRAAKRAEQLARRQSLQSQQDFAAALVEEADEGAQRTFQKIMQPDDYRSR